MRQRIRRMKICITGVARQCELMDIEWAFDSASCAAAIQPWSLFLDWGSARNGTNRSKFRFLNAGTHRHSALFRAGVIRDPAKPRDHLHERNLIVTKQFPRERIIAPSVPSICRLRVE